MRKSSDEFASARSRKSKPSASSRVGRWYLVIAIALLVLSSLTISGTYVLREGTDRLPQQISRVLILTALGYFLLRGHSWARWLTVGLLALAVWVGTRIVLQPGAFSGERRWRTLPILVLYVGHGVVARGLLYSESVRAFFRDRRSQKSRAGSSGAQSQQ